MASRYYCTTGESLIGNYADRIQEFSDEKIGNLRVFSIYDRSTNKKVLTLSVRGSCDEVELGIGRFVIGAKRPHKTNENLMFLPGVTALVKKNQ